MPLSMLFGPDALEYRINDSEATLAIVDESGDRQRARRARRCARSCATVIAVGAAEGRATSTGVRRSARAPARFDADADAAPTTPAVLIYTSGTTGPPKGALIPHRALIGNLPASSQPELVRLRQGGLEAQHARVLVARPTGRGPAG